MGKGVGSAVSRLGQTTHAYLYVITPTLSYKLYICDAEVQKVCKASYTRMVELYVRLHQCQEL